MKTCASLLGVILVAGIALSRSVAGDTGFYDPDRGYGDWHPFVQSTTQSIEAAKVNPAINPFGGPYDVIVVVTYVNCKPTDIYVDYSSGNDTIDKAALSAVNRVGPPTAPQSLRMTEFAVVVPLHFFAPGHVDVESDFVKQLEVAVIAARTFPHSEHDIGPYDVTISFDYKNGASSHIKVEKSSGSRIFDKAALYAVQEASFPPIPKQFDDHVFHVVVPIHFELH